MLPNSLPAEAASPDAPVAGPRGAGMSLLLSEIAVLFRRRRTWALLLALAAIPVSVPLFLPLTVGVVAGDTIAGEANLGTLRYLLVAPAGRVRLLLVKYAGALA